ncbi:hypothetical protein Agub_g5992, partial [Astrephomene gubernaculifera]
MKSVCLNSGQSPQKANACTAPFRGCDRRAMRTRPRGASPGPELPPDRKTVATSKAPRHPSSATIHARQHPTGPSGPKQAFDVTTSGSGPSADDMDEMPKPSLFQRLRRGDGIKRLMKFKVLGLDPSPELIAISMVYFVQGILGLSRLAVSYFFKDELHVEPAEVAFLTGLSSIPWMIKPLYGFISDSVPLFGYRRRSYLVLCGIMGTLAWGSLSYGVYDSRGAVAAMLLASLGTAASDVVVDSIVVERARGHHQSVAGSLQSLCWASAAVGGIASAYFSGSLVQEYGCRFVFGLTAIFPLVVCASSLLIEEKPMGGSGTAATTAASAVVGMSGSNSSSNPHDTSGSSSNSRSQLVVQRLRAQGAALWGAVRQKDILMPAIFVFLWQATPSADSAMFYFQTTQLGFTPEFLGRVRLGASLASLAGVWVYNSWLKSVPLRRMLWWAMLVGTALSSTQLVLVSRLNVAWGVSDQLFVLGDSVVLTVLGQVSFMPILVLAARLCPAGVEATLFATLMSVLNCGSITGGALGAGLTKLYGVTSDNYDHLFALVATCVAATMAPAPFLWLLPHKV